MTAALDALASGALTILGRALAVAERDAFDKYLKLLVKWQRSQRLVGSADENWIVENLVLDSLLFLRVLPEGVTSIADVGSGAGFPGIPLKIVRGHLRVALIESRQRRASFLSAAVRELQLSETRVVNSRVEQYAAREPHKFDAVVMRCAGDFEALAQAASGVVVAGGLIVASGPPEPRALAAGEWVEVEGARPGAARRFVVYRP